MSSFAQKRLTKKITSKFKKMPLRDLVVWSLLAEQEAINRVGDEEYVRLRESLSS